MVISISDPESSLPSIIQLRQLPSAYSTTDTYAALE